LEKKRLTAKAILLGHYAKSPRKKRIQGIWRFKVDGKNKIWVPRSPLYKNVPGTVLNSKWL